MLVAVVGSGKLASELLAQLKLPAGMELRPWHALGSGDRPKFVVHAGSGRELRDVIARCEKSQATLLELSTGSEIETSGEWSPQFPVVLCPNTNMLMLQFMAMLAAFGPGFRNYRVSLHESHQSSKTSAPGTALALAQALGMPAEAIVSQRDPERQMRDFSIPQEHLRRHAVHRILIEDGACAISLEAKVLGDAPYAQGVGQLLAMLSRRHLEPGVYQVVDLIAAERL
jgi:4-hydroxy-tetrahydrodipicolinate reductase